VRRGGSTEPCEATTSVPTGVRASSRPHVPRRMMAIGPSTTARVSRTTKSIMGVPMPVLTIDTGAPRTSPVKIVKPLDDVVSNTSPLATKGSSSPAAARRPIDTVSRCEHCWVVYAEGGLEAEETESGTVKVRRWRTGAAFTSGNAV
jgi:hypothetical protein